MSFSALGLSAPILSAVAAEGYDTMTPIQAQAIPAVLAGKDVMAAAQTGTGKTAGFALPILELLSKGPHARANHIRALVLTPTRELAAQVEESFVAYGKQLPLRSAVVFGGVSINPQMLKLRKGVDILVATPGRLLDLHGQNAVKFAQIEILVLDEADRMLDMGFIHDIRRIIALLPKQRQNLMFSATFSDEIRALARTIVNDPVEISVSPRNSTAESVEQSVYPVDKGRKPALLKELILSNKWQQVLVFTKTKHGANRLAEFLDKNGIHAAAIHGNKSQGARTKALADFKKGAVRILVATDIAARGLDIDQLPQVVNFELPNVPEDYVHRIGRTGRAGATGKAVSLVCAEEARLLFDIERLIRRALPREEVAGFSPAQPLPASRPLNLVAAAPRPKKPPAQPGGQRDGRRSGDSRHRGQAQGKPANRPQGESGNRPQGEARSRPQGDSAHQRHGRSPGKPGSGGQRRHPAGNKG